MNKTQPKFCILSIDGVPIGLLQRFMDQGDMPNMARLAERYPLQQMRSVQPTVSCVAWSTYMTGKNPGKHGIYGFIDRRPDSYDLALPNAQNMATKNIWEMLSNADKRVFGMNVPVSYPPRAVNGVLIGGFLTPTLDKAATPPSENAYLKNIDYRIDSDPALARQDKQAMLGDLKTTLKKRSEAMFHYLDQENWDFCHTHIMGTDRINHFLWQKMETQDGTFAPAFADYYRQVDTVVGKLLDRIDESVPLLLFSDHGFCGIKYEVQLSRVLIDQGWMTAAEKIQHPLSIDPTRTKAYCSIPGRIYINLKGREPGGIVPLEEYDALRSQISYDLLQMRDPQGNPVIQRVFKREEIYWPDNTSGPQSMDPTAVAQSNNTFGKAPDLIAVPYDGYDLKLGLAQGEQYTQTALEGMHTYHDAFMLARHVDLPKSDLEIMQVTASIFETLGLPVPEDLDGRGAAVTPIIN